MELTTVAVRYDCGCTATVPATRYNPALMAMEPIPGTPAEAAAVRRAECEKRTCPDCAAVVNAAYLRRAREDWIRCQTDPTWPPLEDPAC